MTVWIALLRGINVGGRNKLPMADLVSELENVGLRDPKTYIQSGNAVFRSEETEAAALADRIATAVEAGHGFRPRVTVLTLEALRAAVAGNPFSVPDAGAKTVHLFFLSEPASDPDLAGLDAATTETEEYVLTPGVLYLHAPDGVGRSKFAGRAERLLRVPATARNLRSAGGILELAEGI